MTEVPDLTGYREQRLPGSRHRRVGPERDPPAVAAASGFALLPETSGPVWWGPRPARRRITGHYRAREIAAAACEAVTRPSMRFVAVKSAAQQSVLMLHRTRERAGSAAVIGDRNRAHKHVLRARIVLLPADRPSESRVARGVGVSRPAVWRRQRRFAEEEGLLRDNIPPPGKPPSGRARRWSGCWRRSD